MNDSIQVTGCTLQATHDLRLRIECHKPFPLKPWYSASNPVVPSIEVRGDLGQRQNPRSTIGIFAYGCVVLLQKVKTIHYEWSFG
jgi:hypothetical protein